MEFISKYFRQCVDDNGLAYKDIMQITGKTENTVFKWLNGTLTPDNFSLYLFVRALSAAGMKVDVHLRNYMDNKLKKAFSWGSRKKAKINEIKNWKKCKYCETSQPEENFRSKYSCKSCSRKRQRRKLDLEKAFANYK